jgi:hypothetical protein
MNASLRSVLLVLSTLLATIGACAAPHVVDPPPDLQGTWIGEGRVNVDWVARRRLAVELVISAEGLVSGRVGDARLVEGFVRTNRSEVSRALGIWSDWAIEGRLQDELLADERFVAQRVLIPIDLSAGRLEGRVHADGAFLDGRRGGRLDVIELALVRR